MAHDTLVDGYISIIPVSRFKIFFDSNTNSAKQYPIIMLLGVRCL